MKNLLLLFVFTFTSFILNAQESIIPNFITNDLETYIQKGMSDWKIPGMAVAIVKDGKVILQKGYGTSETGEQIPVDEHTTFMIGSNTKAFTATAITILQEEGKLNIKNKVQKLMPEFKLKNELASAEVNIADLLSHRIGFETFQGDFTYWLSKLSREEVIQKMSLVDAPYSFRSRWGYCNAAYVAAGEIIPRVTRKSWEETVREKILTPLKMNRTLMLCSELENAANNASGHTIVDDKLIAIPSHHLPNHGIDNLAAAGAMSSSASDMAKWLQVQLNYGEVDGKEVISKKAIHATREPHSILGLDTRDKKNTHFYLYGLGLMINDRAGKVVYSHTGGIDGFLSSVLFIPEEQLGIVVLTNTDQNSFYEDLTNQIRDAFLNLPFENYSEKSLLSFQENEADKSTKIDAFKSVVKEKNGTSLPLESFTGIYNNTFYGPIEIKKEADKLKIYFSNHIDLTAELEHMKDNVFLCSYSNPIFGIVDIPFKTDGVQVLGLNLKVADYVEATEYEFMKKN